MAQLSLIGNLRAKAANWLAPRALAPAAGGWVDVSPAQPPGYFQLDMAVRPETILAHPAVYACVSLIANDIGKLRARLMAQTELEGRTIWAETSRGAFSPVLRKPNRYQNHIQFKQWWVTSKLTRGNTYVLLQRDGRGAVVSMYILDPQCVTPLVAPDGSIFYQLTPDNLTGLETTTLIVPASEIIHDRMNCMFHPLVGVSPLFAANMAAQQGIHIQKDSVKFFSQGAKPSGVLVAPGNISQHNANEVRNYWNTNFTGDNAGKVAVVGDGLKYQPIRMTSIDSQLSEQFKQSAEAIAQAFHVPAFKLVLGALPAGLKVGDMNQIYYTDCLHAQIEEMEAALDEGLALPSGLRVELELDNLLRMDQIAQAEMLGKLVGGAIMAPNEARERVSLPPVKGGDAVYLQQQNFSLAALDERDKTSPLASSAPAEPAPNDDDEESAEEMRSLFDHIKKGLACELT